MTKFTSIGVYEIGFGLQLHEEYERLSKMYRITLARGTQYFNSLGIDFFEATPEIHQRVEQLDNQERLEAYAKGFLVKLLNVGSKEISMAFWDIAYVSLPCLDAEIQLFNGAGASNLQPYFLSVSI